MRRGQRVQFGKSAGDEDKAVAEFGSQRIGKRLHAGITVNADDGGPRLQQGARITAGAKGAVDNALAVKRSKGSQNLVQQDGAMRASLLTGFGHGTLAHKGHYSATSATCRFVNLPLHCITTFKILFPMRRLAGNLGEAGTDKINYCRLMPKLAYYANDA